MIILQPAYGRDYKSVKEVKQAIAENKDFILNDFGNRFDGKPCSLLISKGKLYNSDLKPTQNKP